MKKWSIGMYPYLNMAPFRFPEDEDVDILYGSPAGIADRARADSLDFAILSVTELHDLRSSWEPLGPYGIGTRSRAQSVLLFSHKPIAELSRARIWATLESRTSIRLLEILLQNKYGITNYTWTPDEHEADAELWIGDKALLKDRSNRDRAVYRYDLGLEWTEWQYLPFVFARWMVRKDVPEAMKCAFGYRLGHRLETHLENLAELTRQFHGPLDPSSALLYLRGFIYRFGPTEDLGLARFEEYLDRPVHEQQPSLVEIQR